MIDHKTVRRALKDWDLLSRLGENPLAGLSIVQDRLGQNGYSPSAAGRGLALREQIQAAIEQLKPEEGPQDSLEKRWRPYLIVTEQYLSGRSPEFVQEKLHVSRGTYFEEQNRAIEMLADLLIRREEQRQGQKKTNGADLHPAAGRDAPPPFLAPPRPSYPLVGRDRLIADLKNRLLSGGPAGQGQAVLALQGLPGAGKTRIAIELASDPEVRERYRDGVLWAGLGRQPDLMATLGTWAGALSLPAEAISACPGCVERAALIHAAIGLRRMLLVLDDAWQAEAALTFKVGGPNCATLLTTRHANLAIDFSGAEVLAIRELEPEDGLDLLLRLAPRAVDAGLDEIQGLVRSVGGLPLALILMGRYLQKQSYGAQPRRLKEALAHLKAVEARLTLAQAQSPLELGPGIQADIPFSLKTVIGISELALDPVPRQALADLALFPARPNTFSEEAALAVTAAPTSGLDALVDCGLVETASPDRYSLHQTVADYAVLKGASPAATRRMLGYFVRFAEANAEQFPSLERELSNLQAVLAIANQTKQFRALISLVSALYPFLETRGLFSLCAEQLTRVSRAVETLGDQEERAFLLHWLGSFAIKRGSFPEALQHLQQSILQAQAARARAVEGSSLFTLYGVGDESLDAAWGSERQLKGMVWSASEVAPAQPAVARGGFSLYGVRSASLDKETRVRALEGHNLYDLGLTRMYMGNFIEGCANAQKSLRIYQELNMRAEEGLALNALGFAQQESGDYLKSRGTLEQALLACQESGNRRGEGWARQNLSALLLALGDLPRAMEQAQQSGRIYAESGDRRGSGWQMLHRGRIQRQMGERQAAACDFQEALAILSGIGDWMGRGFAAQALGLAKGEAGEAGEAAQLFEQSGQIFEKIGCQTGLFHHERDLGNLLRASGDHPSAAAHLDQALRLAREMMLRRGECVTLADLGLVCLRLGDCARACACGEQAVKIAQAIGARPAQAKAWLTLGYAYRESHRLEEARAAFQRSLEIRHALGQEHLVQEPREALAKMAYTP